MDQPSTLEEFRKFLFDEYTAKGIMAPPADSSEEKELYERWLAGAERLNSMDS
jgi:hypothetical protein